MFLNFGQLCGFEIYGGTEWAVKITAAFYDISTKSPRLKANVNVNVSYLNIFGGKRAKKHTLTAQILLQSLQILN